MPNGEMSNAEIFQGSKLTLFSAQERKKLVNPTERTLAARESPEKERGDQSLLCSQRLTAKERT